MKKRVKVLMCALAIVVMFASNMGSHAEGLLCGGNHNYYHQTYLQNPVLLTVEDIEDGGILSEYGWWTYEADRYGICVCGAHSYLGKYRYKVKQRIIR